MWRVQLHRDALPVELNFRWLMESVVKSTEEHETGNSTSSPNVLRQLNCRPNVTGKSRTVIRASVARSAVWLSRSNDHVRRNALNEKRRIGVAKEGRV
ncbi:hypothetical protein DBV15_11927 [Temnothorax longispinosus]|uniref:Uncharacterized protein n=1 Tax=Temnothorax longispinosus TaxID=300112 RepID=A0A4S2JDE1_9HYME|nr:hypothetical protein DBV15_11927 [Temnothorax longispinosus]